MQWFVIYWRHFLLLRASEPRCCSQRAMDQLLHLHSTYLQG